MHGDDYPDTSRWLGDFPNLVVTRTFSKAYGLAGLRVGYAVSHPEVAGLLNRVRHPFNVNLVALAGAEAALDDEDFIARSLQVNAAGMEQLSLGFEDLKLSSLPSVGNFLCTRVWRDGRAVYQALLREGVIVRPLGNVVVLMPPLGIAPDNLDRLVDVVVGQIGALSSAG